MDLIEEKGRNSLDCVGTGKDVLNRTLLAYGLRPTVNKRDLMELRSFCTAKDITIQTKRQPIEWKKMLTNYICDRGLIFKYIKNTKK